MTLPNQPGLAEIPAQDGGPGSDILSDGLKLQTIGDNSTVQDGS